MAGLLDGAGGGASNSLNRLYYGDNLDIMQNKLGLESVDLIYLDPPFKSDTNYNLMYRNLTGKPVPEQVHAFADTWEFDAEKERIAREIPTLMIQQGIDPDAVQFWTLWVDALRKTNRELLAYLIYMVQRMLFMKSILKRTGSIYLHCDPTASHYIKVMMDAIFGHDNFRNEIIWKRTGSHGGSKRWGPVHDVILFYTKSSKYTWNRVFQEYEKSYLDDFYRFSDGKGRYRLVTLTGAGVRTGDSGKPWRNVDPTASGRHWAVPIKSLQRAYPDHDFAGLSTQEKLDLLDKAGLVYWPPRGSVPQQKRYADENPGVPVQDIVTDIGPVSSQANERLGYPTQKPVPLLDRIIQASSNPGDVVFDPFCGCGTTIYSAVKNERRWIGCDIAILPIQMVTTQLAERHRLVQGIHFEVDGVPISVEQARHLFDRNPYQFQQWFVERVGGFPMQKKVADRGIDGRLYFQTNMKLEQIILSVKGGKLKPTDVRDLRGVMEREKCPIAGFLCLNEPTKAMRQEAEDAGEYEYMGIPYKRLQLLSATDVLERGMTFHTPTKVSTKFATGQGSLALM
ncbi:restriction endonuclease subunit M [Sphingobium sp. TA15]|nr:restriction endonuclease subunit M [Sphingobium sp. TA15]